MLRLIILLLIFGIFISCQHKQGDKTPEIEFQYYDEEFELSPTSKLRTDGYYEVIQIFGTYTMDEKTSYINEPNYGFVHFFPDGFCRIGFWNGIMENQEEVEYAFKNDDYVFLGLYKIESDTIKIEYLSNPASPGAVYRDNRLTMTGLIRNNKINFLSDDLRRYSYPINPSDSLESSCIGRFRESDFDMAQWSNYLKENINKYIKTDLE